MSSDSSLHSALGSWLCHLDDYYMIIRHRSGIPGIVREPIASSLKGGEVAIYFSQKKYPKDTFGVCLESQSTAP